MFDKHSLASIGARFLLAATAACMLPLAGCVKAGPAQPDAKVTITATQPSGTYQPGDDVSIRVTVTNTGAMDARYVTIGAAISPYLYERSIKCSPLGPSGAGTGQTATCGDLISLQSLAKGQSVTIDIVAAVRGDAPASVVSQFSAAVLQGPPLVQADSQANVVDQRSGAYKVFASDGHQFDLAADFPGDAFTFSGNGADTTFHGLLIPGSLHYWFGETGTFMAHHDLLAGNVPLDGGTPVFLAARKFVTTVAGLENQSFNVFGVATPTTGTRSSLFRSMAISGGTLQVCADATPHAIASCPAGATSSYALSVNAGVFTGVDAASGDTITFQVAQSDDALVFLRAESTSTGRVFQVGLSTNSGITDQLLWGAGNNGDQAGTLQFVGDVVQEVFGGETRAGHMTVPAGGPAGLAASPIVAANPIQAWIAQDKGLAVVMAQPGSSQDGLLQVFAY
jgi:hypothetical protein